MGDAPQPVDPLVGQVIEKCRILSKIAQGGMGNVYLAEHTALQRRVAIKMLPPELARNHDYVERFRRESIATARLEHPNIVQVYDVGEHAEAPFMIMQYVEGFTVAEILKRSGKLEPREAARIARDVARGLSAAHAEGIVHRDVKPANILISGQDEVRLTDFGIAIEADAQSGLIAGSPNYISPEQAEGRKSDARSDLYSLGATLYFMVTGHPPFTADSPMALTHKHINETPKRPSTLEPAIPRIIDDLIMRLLMKRPENRYQTAAELEADLDRFVRGIVPRARMAPVDTAARPGPRGAYDTTRHRMTPPRPPKAALFAVAGAAAVLVIGLIVIFGSGGKTKPPIPPPLTVDLNAQRRVEAEAAEARGDNDAAIKLFREIGDAVSVQRIENSIRRRAEDEAFAAIETEYKTGLKERFRELADAFLRNHPASRHARDVKAMLGPVPPPPSAETGFAKVYSSAEDKLFWTHTSDLARRVFFTADTILVSIPVAQSDPDEVEFLTLQDGNIEEYAFRFDFLPKLGTVGVCVGGRYRGDPALPGRTGWMPVSLGGLAPNAWHPVEVIVKEGKVTATSGGQALTSGPLAEKTSPFGHVGFFCRPGADFEIRNPRVAVHKRFDTTKLPNKTETAPPPPVVPVPVPVPVPPPPVKPDPGIVPAPALEAVRNHQYAKAAAALKGAEGEASRLLLERVEAAMAVLKETRETLKKDQSIDLIQRSGSKLQVKFIDTTETEIAVLYGGGRVTYRWAEIHPQFALNVLKNARKTTKLQRALFLLVESDPATALELMGQETVPGHREDAESAALAELDALLDAKKTAPAQALLKRLEAVKVAKLAERAIRLEVSGAKTDLDRAKIYVKHGKGAEAEALIAPLLKAAKATDVPGLAKILRDCVFARNPADLFNGRDLEGWTINPASQDIPQASGGVLTLACAGRFVQLQNDRIPLAQGLTFEARLKKIHEPGRGLGLWFHRINGQVYKQFTIRVATTDLQDVTGDEAKKLAGRAVAAGPEKWVRVDFFASAGQAYLFVDDAFLWRGDSPEESALGAGIGFLARDIDVDLRHIKVIEK